MFDDEADVGINQLSKVECFVETSSSYVYLPHNSVQVENFRILWKSSYWLESIPKSCWQCVRWMCGSNTGMVRTIALCLHIVQDAHRREALVQIKAFFLELLLHWSGMRALCTDCGIPSFVEKMDCLLLAADCVSLFDGCKQSTALQQLWTSLGGPCVYVCVCVRARARVSRVVQDQLTPAIVVTAQSFGSRSVKVSSPPSCEMFLNVLSFYGEELLATCPTPKLEDHPLSTVRECLYGIFLATLCTWKPFIRTMRTRWCGDGNLR
jgi:hypothetical protein